MNVHIVVGTESHTTSTTNMYDKGRFHVRVFAFGFLVAFKIPAVEVGGTGKPQFVGTE